GARAARACPRAPRRSRSRRRSRPQRAAQRHDAEQDAEGVDRDVVEGAVPAADEGLMRLVARGVRDAEDERRQLASDRTQEQEAEDRVLRHVRALAQYEIPGPEPGAE